MSGAILRRRDRTARSLRVVHYSSAVNTNGLVEIRARCPVRALLGKPDRLTWETAPLYRKVPVLGALYLTRNRERCI